MVTTFVTLWTARRCEPGTHESARSLDTRKQTPMTDCLGAPAVRIRICAHVAAALRTLSARSGPCVRAGGSPSAARVQIRRLRNPSRRTAHVGFIPIPQSLPARLHASRCPLPSRRESSVSTNSHSACHMPWFACRGLIDAKCCEDRAPDLPRPGAARAVRGGRDSCAKIQHGIRSSRLVLRRSLNVRR